ncbi:substrate-binding periplasmic protein [Psychromonas ossibalaenae]|uniref:substrate-binding periplasmic protein n=1 Tax=Psychromonas ossibalaenae TaxID=444922 RepID=UPI00037288CB|nr:transporter substrate-binding domain-containing protein [Psychromonas ossibalaenae]
MKYISLALLLVLSSAVQAKTLTLIAGLSLPPYVIQESDSGMEYDVIKEALAFKGHTLVMKYVPFARVSVDYPKYDGAITINESSGAKGNYSDQVITYQNYAVTLKNKGIKINSIQDLQDQKIIAFQNATKYLGDEFAQVVKGNSKYRELGQQVKQVKLLYSGRTDVVVSDINIFKYFRKSVTDVDTTAEITLHEIFAAVGYKVLFNDVALRDDFNAGLKSLKASGRYDEIVNSYIK